MIHTNVFKHRHKTKITNNIDTSYTEKYFQEKAYVGF